MTAVNPAALALISSQVQCLSSLPAGELALCAGGESKNLPFDIWVARGRCWHWVKGTELAAKTATGSGSVWPTSTSRRSGRS